MNPTLAALDPAVETLDQVDALAGLVRDALAGRPGGAPDWIVSHWIDHDPGTGGAHLALSFAWDGPVDEAHVWASLRAAADLAADQDYVYGGADELGIAVAARAAGLPRLAGSARTCLEVHAARSSGRAIVFPGGETATAAYPVSDLVAGTAIQAVCPLAAGDVAPDTVVHTRGFLRPVFRAGRLVLPVVPFGDGDVAPFEVRDPTPCCADH